jgi:heat shock protein HslJ
MNRLTTLVVLSLALLVACNAQQEPTATTTRAAEMSTAPSSPEQLAAATYTGIEEQPVTLTDGRWEGEPYSPEGASRPAVILVNSVAPTGDLDGDGSPETVAALAQSGGGTGSNIHLAVVKSTGDGVENVATALVGDRVQIVSLDAENGFVSGVFVQAGEGDAMCCPTAKIARSWKLQNGALVEQPAEDLGKVSIADLAGDWTLVELPRGTPLPEGVEVTLTFDGTTASGTSGCNTYSGSIAEKAPRELEPGLFMGTQMFCEGPSMEVESAYMKALGGASQYSFLGTRLAITYATDEGGVGEMLFEKAE